ncbi:hypothetical protein MRB53_010034 [Persea americana]|uniref:Uncharacterized protein n=1 Tax=Persea americana TaxID=3435 RepID=A0ACC2LQU0_PERAE|nr:hypothetical protein MRB53_010034 [Persea americana]
MHELKWLNGRDHDRNIPIYDPDVLEVVKRKKSVVLGQDFALCADEGEADGEEHGSEAHRTEGAACQQGAYRVLEGHEHGDASAGPVLVSDPLDFVVRWEFQIILKEDRKWNG